MTDPDTQCSELRPCYRTINEPARLLGLTPGGWSGVIAAAALAYAFVGLSPLPWRLNFSVVAIGLGGPLVLLILREPGTIGPGRLLAAVVAWRFRPVDVVAPDGGRPVRRGGTRLDVPMELVDEADALEVLPWTEAAR